MAKFRGLWSKRRTDTEFDEELRMHLGLLAERYAGLGMDPAEAMAAARRQFGNVALLQQDRREMQTSVRLETLWRDVRSGARQLKCSPLFTTIAVLSLALGIGANTAVFTLLDQLALRPLPVKDPQRLVMIWSTGPYLGNNNGVRMASYPMYQDLQRLSVAFDYVFCRFDTTLALGLDGSTEPVSAELVSGNYFQALRTEPAAGRLFSPETDDRVHKGHPVVVLSYRYWVQRFAADRGAVGRKILVSNYPMEIVGVAAPGFTGIDPSRAPHIWAPIQMKPLMSPEPGDLGDRRSQWVQMFARLKAGFTVESARSSLQPVFHSILEQELSDTALSWASQYQREQFLKRSVLVETAATGYSDLRQQYTSTLVVLMAMAALILLAACSNLSGLLLARAVARQKEMAVHLAIGAARGTLIRRLLVESVLLSLTGSVMGLVLSFAVTRGLLNLLPVGGAISTLRAEPDGRILLFSAGVAIATALLFGLAPALAATRLDLWTALKEDAATGSGGASARFRKMLIAAQVALSFLLLAGAGLFSRTLINLKREPNGFENIDRIVTFRIELGKNGYRFPRIHEFCIDALRQVRAIPGVKSAAFTFFPLLRGYTTDSLMKVEGRQATDGEDMQAYDNAISPGYWQTMGVRLLEGRDFDDRDRIAPSDANKSPVDLVSVAIVNRAFAEHFFGARTPIGRYIGFGGPGGKLRIRIVGEVENSLYGGPREGVRRQVFFPFLQAGMPLPATFYIRTGTQPGLIFGQLRKIVARLDPSVPIYDMKTLAAQFDESLSTERLIALLSVVFGGLATVMAALGLYGVMSFLVARRTREIGLRIALGARPRGALWLVLREALVMLGAGLAPGIAAAYACSRYVSAQLFGVKPADALVFGAAISILSVVGCVSALAPARKASAIDPIRALRRE